MPIKLKDGKQVLPNVPGRHPALALRNPTAIVFDEYECRAVADRDVRDPARAGS